jgi:hypothetical protein
MLLQIRSIAVSAAVLCFFFIGIVGSLGGLSPGTCCRRAVLGAAIVYLAVGVAVRAVNAILTQALITDRMQKEHPGDNKGQRHP